MQVYTIYYLEMLDASWHQVKMITDPQFRIFKVNVPTPSFNRYFYHEVGKAWDWTDRYIWTEADWERYATAPTLHTHVAFYDGAPAGYYELEQIQKTVNIAYFGLMSAFVGKGLGSALLSSAINHAWALGPECLTVNTCTLDHPAALANYRARGFREYKQEVKMRR